MRKFFTSESGQGLSEYGLILALIAVVAVAALTTLGDGIAAYIQDIAGNFTTGQ